MNTQQLPHRFRERSCRKYESTIAAALAGYPNHFKILTQAGGLSLSTISNRLRDAIMSWRQHKWPSTQFSIEDLCSKSIKVSEVTDCVIVSFRATDMLSPVVTHADLNVMRAAIDKNLVHHVISDEDLMGTIHLAATGGLNAAVYVKLTEEQAETLEYNHDIALILQPDGLYKLT